MIATVDAAVGISIALLALVACRGDPSPEALPPAPSTPLAASDSAAPPRPVTARDDSAAPADAATPPCEPLPFGATTPVPEASGAAWLDNALVVISDSGNDGAYGIVDPDTGATREQGKLPLGGGGADLEGLAARDGKLFGLSSSGWMTVWRRDGKGFSLVDGPYAIAPVDASPARATTPRAPAGDAMVCALKGTNCGRNYEGLALAPHTTPGGCAGFACSKADGKLYCLTEQDGRFAVDRARSIAVDRPGVLADCAFTEDGTLYAADNVFGLSQVYRIEMWADPAEAKVVPLEQLGVGFPEVIAARGDVIYRMSDTGGAPSLMVKFRCRPIAR